MADKNMTPEEKLLKIIEGPVPEKAASPRIIGGKPAGFSFDTLIGQVKAFRLNFDSLKNFDLAKINKAAVVLCAVSTVFLLFYFVREGFAFRDRFNKVKADALLLTSKEEARPSLDMNISDLMASAAKRNIFTSSLQSGMGSTQEVDSEPAVSAEAAEASGVNLKLVGIIWSDNPQAMLEDSKEQKTYLVSAGDSIGALKVNKILSNKVIIGKGEKEWELR